MPLKRVQKLLAARDFLRHSLLLASGTSLAQLIPAAVSPVLTRLFAPEEFALLAGYLAISSLFAVVATARYELAVVLPKSDRDAASILVLSLMVASCVAVVGGVTVQIFQSEIAEGLGNRALADWLFLMPLSVFAIALYRTLGAWANRKTRYKPLALARITQTSTTATANVSGGITWPSGGVLILGEVAGHLMAAAWLALGSKRDLGTLKHVSCRRIFLNAKRYSDFPKINTFHALVDVLKTSGSVFLISMFFGSISLGLYALTMRILLAPVGLISNAIGQVFYQRASAMFVRGDDVHALIVATTKQLALVSVPVFGCLMILAPQMFGVVFGKEWVQAGIYTQYLVPWVACQFIVTPVSHVPLIVGKQEKAFLFGLVGNLLVLASIAAGGIMGDLKVGLGLVSTTMMVYFGIYLSWILAISRIQSRSDPQSVTGLEP